MYFGRNLPTIFKVEGKAKQAEHNVVTQEDITVSS
jgi:hypothetical protein